MCPTARLLWPLLAEGVRFWDAGLHVVLVALAVLCSLASLPWNAVAPEQDGTEVGRAGRRCVWVSVGPADE